MEHGRFDLLPGRFYRRSFLKAYAEYLKLDADHLLRMLEEREPPPKKGEEGPPLAPKARMDELAGEDWTKEEGIPPEVPAPEPAPSQTGAGYWFSVFFGLVVGAACLVFLFNLGIRKQQDVSAVEPVAEPESLVVIPEPPDTMELFANLLDKKIGAAPELILRLEFAGESWISVICDRVKLYEGYIYPSMNVEFKATERMSLNLGINQGVKAWLNGFEMRPIGRGVTYLNRENFKEFIPTDRANEIVRAHE
jgi:hypothetical protein